MTLNASHIALLVIGFVMTVGGFCVHFLGMSRDSKNAYKLHVVSWLFIPVFPLLLILLAFPDNSISGTFLNFTIGGAFAAYVLLWAGGIKFTGSAETIDDLRNKNAELEAKCEYVQVVNDIIEGESPKKLHEALTHTYKLTNAPNKTITLRTGDIGSVHGIDIWVNSENTDMQMARFGESTVSSIIRYLGAAKDDTHGHVTEDTIADSLRETLGKATQVAPAAVVVTGPGALHNSNSVQKIFHVASVHGLPASGYRPIKRLGDCVTNCLREADKPENAGLRSIIFPLMGTGTGGGELEAVVEELVKSAINYLENKPGGAIEEVAFLTYTNQDLAICQMVLMDSDRIEKPTA